MNAFKTLAFVLITAGVLALAYGGFTYTRETHETRVGPIHLSVSDNERVNIPVWAGALSIIAGVLLLVVPRKR
ncbi:MAG: hypothetical protein IPO95_11080 [Rhodanobacteraceae bacterium]|nr:hypothetical protein [Rhodanobacteraceae bacterium]MBL0042547.1 hypothetical protein [Xanthomonadales bacterium]MBP6077205.1 hypothetical protein [Xanthomonadales bacterium]MBP7624737.1 hypothetical protein [Xanthomonadales bacterium]